MAIYYNGNMVNTIFYNGTGISQVYYNGTKVYPDTPPAPTTHGYNGSTFTAPLAGGVYCAVYSWVGYPGNDAHTVTVNPKNITSGALSNSGSANCASPNHWATVYFGALNYADLTQYSTIKINFTVSSTNSNVSFRGIKCTVGNDQYYNRNLWIFNSGGTVSYNSSKASSNFKFYFTAEFGIDSGVNLSSTISCTITSIVFS